MALVVSSLQQDIYNALKANWNAKDNPEAQMQRFAKDLAVAIDKYIKSGEVAPGIAVATSGGAGATTAPGKII